MEGKENGIKEIMAVLRVSTNTYLGSLLVGLYKSLLALAYAFAIERR